MIAVIRINGEPPGVCTYALQINRERLLTFEHRYSDGLAACLRRAADAYDEHRESIVSDIAARWVELEKTRKEVGA